MISLFKQGYNYDFNILYNIFCISEKEENMFVELNICCDKMHENDI